MPTCRTRYGTFGVPSGNQPRWLRHRSTPGWVAGKWIRLFIRPGCWSLQILSASWNSETSPACEG